MTTERDNEIFEQAREIVLATVADVYDTRLAFSKSESPIEQMMFCALVAETWGLEPYFKVTQQVNAGKYRVDFLLDYCDLDMDASYVASVAVECDGHDFHEKTKEQAQRDKRRDRDLLAMDLQTLRYTGSEVYADPFKCAREALDRVTDVYYHRVLGPSKVAQ